MGKDSDTQVEIPDWAEGYLKDTVGNMGYLQDYFWGGLRDLMGTMPTGGGKGKVVYTNRKLPPINDNASNVGGAGAANAGGAGSGTGGGAGYAAGPVNVEPWQLMMGGGYPPVENDTDPGIPRVEPPIIEDPTITVPGTGVGGGGGPIVTEDPPTPPKGGEDPYITTGGGDSPFRTSMDFLKDILGLNPQQMAGLGESTEWAKGMIPAMLQSSPETMKGMDWVNELVGNAYETPDDEGYWTRAGRTADFGNAMSLAGEMPTLNVWKAPPDNIVTVPPDVAGGGGAAAGGALPGPGAGIPGGNADPNGAAAAGGGGAATGAGGAFPTLESAVNGPVRIGNVMTDDPMMAAAYELFKGSGEERIKNAQSLGGFGRSTATLDALSKGWGDMALPLMQQRLQFGNEAINRKLGVETGKLGAMERAIQRQQQAESENIGRKERGIERGQAGKKYGIETMLGSGRDYQSNLRNAIATALGVGEQEQATAQGQSDANERERLRRMALGESSMLPIISGIIPGIFGSSTGKS